MHLQLILTLFTGESTVARCAHTLPSDSITTPSVSTQTAQTTIYTVVLLTARVRTVDARVASTTCARARHTVTCAAILTCANLENKT